MSSMNTVGERRIKLGLPQRGYSYSKQMRNTQRCAGASTASRRLRRQPYPLEDTERLDYQRRGWQSSGLGLTPDDGDVSDSLSSTTFAEAVRPFKKLVAISGLWLRR